MIFEMQQLCAVCNPRATVTRSDPGWDQQSLCEHMSLVCHAVMIKVFHNDNAIGRRSPRHNLWINL